MTVKYTILNSIAVTGVLKPNLLQKSYEAKLEQINNKQFCIIGGIVHLAMK